MKNIELLNLCYKFFNRFIKPDEFTKKLDILNNKEDECLILIKGIKEIINKYKDNNESLECFYEVTKFINDNSYFNSCFDSLSDYELLEFIAQYIKAPFPPFISQEEFDRLVNAGIDKDEREWLWRLAFNYVDRDININSIAEYFINVKDGYYLTELICIASEKLDIDKIIDDIHDKELINELKKRKSILEHNLSDEQFNKLMNK